MEAELVTTSLTPGIYDVFYSLDTKVLVPGIPWTGERHRGEGPGTAELLRVSDGEGRWTNRHDAPGLPAARGLYVGTVLIDETGKVARAARFKLPVVLPA